MTLTQTFKKDHFYLGYSLPTSDHFKHYRIIHYHDGSFHATNGYVLFTSPIAINELTDSIIISETTLLRHFETNIWELTEDEVRSHIIMEMI